jgi:hypothetical protein
MIFIGVIQMSFPKDEINREMNEAWNSYVDALEKSLDIIEKDIEEAKELAGVCTGNGAMARNMFLTNWAMLCFRSAKHDARMIAIPSR